MLGSCIINEIGLMHISMSYSTYSRSEANLINDAGKGVPVNKFVFIAYIVV